MEGYRALCAQAEKDYEGFWAGLAREHAGLEKAFHQGAGREQRAVLSDGSTTAK